VRQRVTLRLRSSLSVDECRARLREACDEERLRLWGVAGYKGSRPVIGRFDGARFTLHRRAHGVSEPTLLAGRLVAVAGGTRIEGGLRTPWGLRLTLFVAMMVLVVLVAHSFARHTPTPFWLPAVFFGSVILIGAAGDVRQARRQRAFLTTFVREALSARGEISEVAG
jgi:hypothetical protein